MNEELTIAIDELRKMPSDKTWFIPILINDTTIPSRKISNVEYLHDIQAAKLYDNWEEGINKILRVLKYDDPILARVWHLMGILDGPFHKERQHAIEQLGDLKIAERSVIAALIKGAKENNTEIKSASLNALGKIGPPAAAAVPALVAALEDANVDVRWAANRALGGIGPAAVPALVDALQHPEEDVRWHAATALGGIGPAAVPALAAALEDPKESVRLRAAAALKLIGKDLRGWAPAALRKMDLLGAAVPALVAILKSSDYRTREIAARTLGDIGPVADDAAPALAEALKDPEEGVRRDAAAALRRIRDNQTS
jgi:HEAT repeat protein